MKAVLFDEPFALRLLNSDIEQPANIKQRSDHEVDYERGKRKVQSYSSDEGCVVGKVLVNKIADAVPLGRHRYSFHTW